APEFNRLTPPSPKSSHFQPPATPPPHQIHSRCSNCPECNKLAETKLYINQLILHHRQTHKPLDQQFSYPELFVPSSPETFFPSAIVEQFQEQTKKAVLQAQIKLLEECKGELTRKMARWADGGGSGDGPNSGPKGPSNSSSAGANTK